MSNSFVNRMFSKLMPKKETKIDILKPVVEKSDLRNHVEETIYWEVQWQKGTFGEPIIVRSICSYNNHRHIVETRVWQYGFKQESVDFMIDCILNHEAANFGTKK